VKTIEAWASTILVLLVMLVIPARASWLAFLVIVGLPVAVLLAVLV